MPKRLTQVEKDQRKRSRLDRQQREMLHIIFDSLNAENTDRLLHIDKGEFDEAIEESLQVESDDDDSPLFYVVNQGSWTAARFVSITFFGENEIVLANDVDCQACGCLVVNRRNWHEQFDEMTRVQKLVHLAKRYAIDEIATVKAALMRLQRRAYEAEITIQAQHAGCDRQGHLTNEFIMSDLELSARDNSEDIANTYNYDLAIAIQKLSHQNPRGNRHYYAFHLGVWEVARDEWKVKQIQQFESNTARALAMKHFSQRNRDIMGTAKLVPKKAVCPICIGWVERGVVPLRVAVNNPPPYHVNCPHRWHTVLDKIPAELCRELWIGGD